MANYAEQTRAVTTWLRVRRVQILNPYGGVAEVRLEEERATQINGEPPTFAPTEVLKRDFDPVRVIQIIDPTTGQDTGQTMTEGQVYAALYSAYLQMAQVRDAGG